MIIRSPMPGGDFGTLASANRNTAPASPAQTASQPPIARARRSSCSSRTAATAAAFPTGAATEPPPRPARPSGPAGDSCAVGPHWLVPSESGGPESFSPRGTLTTLELSPHFNTRLDQGTPNRQDNHWRSLPRGEQTLAGVKFRVGPRGRFSSAVETPGRTVRIRS